MSEASNLGALLQETKSAHVVMAHNGSYDVRNQDDAFLANLETEHLANQWMRENLRGKSFAVGEGDTTRDRVDAPQNPEIELRGPYEPA